MYYELLATLFFPDQAVADHHNESRCSWFVNEILKKKPGVRFIQLMFVCVCVIVPYYLHKKLYMYTYSFKSEKGITKCIFAYLPRVQSAYWLSSAMISSHKLSFIRSQNSRALLTSTLPATQHSHAPHPSFLHGVEVSVNLPVTGHPFLLLLLQ